MVEVFLNHLVMPISWTISWSRNFHIQRVQSSRSNKRSKTKQKPKQTLRLHPNHLLRALREYKERIMNYSAPGKDKTYNLMLKNLTPQFLQFILTLFNLCMCQGVSPKIWKFALVTMIPKWSKIATDPNNLRAISLICGLSKLL